MISACQTSECLEGGKCVTIPNGQCRKDGDGTCKLFNGDKEVRNQEGQCLDQCPDGKGYDSADKDTTRECKACTLPKIGPNDQGQCAVCQNSECIKDGKCVPLPDGQCRKEEDGKCQAFSGKEGNYREMPPVNKVKIAILAQMWRFLPPNLEFWQFFAMASWLVYILGQKNKL